MIAAWHAKSGFNYPLPNFAPNANAVMGVAEERGKVAAAGVVGLIGEQYLWLDPDASPRTQVRAALSLQEALELDAKFALGLSQIIAWLPPAVNPRFAAQLERLGWRKSEWQSWAKNL